jgi:hypothetical protein
MVKPRSSYVYFSRLALTNVKSFAEGRRRLWTDKIGGKGFEDTLADLQQRSGQDARVGQMANDLVAALVGMFNLMDQAFASVEFEFQNARQYLVSEFLARFDAIFTLNQDLLLERHYLNQNIMLSDGRKWPAGWQRPGLKPFGPPAHVYNAVEAVMAAQTPDPSAFKVAPGAQPYFKLHGSTNFVRDPGGRIIVMGGNKAAGIEQEPLLNFYRGEFTRYITQGSKLMVIGYSFSDSHINTAISLAVQHQGLKVFIVDPDGVDVLDKSNGKHPAVRYMDPLMGNIGPHVIGASRRPLSATFAHDRVEHGKLMRVLQG